MVRADVALAPISVAHPLVAPRTEPRARRRPPTLPAPCPSALAAIPRAPDAGTRRDLAYLCSVAPVATLDAQELLHVARQGCAQTLAGKDTASHAFALVALGAVQVRVGEYECAEASLVRALDCAQDEYSRALRAGMADDRAGP